MNTETYNDWSFVSLSPWSGLSLWFLCSLVVLATCWVIWRYRGGRRFLLLSSVRLAGALVVLGFLLEPAVQLRVVRKIKNRFVVVVDRSRSMSIEIAKKTRYATVRALLEQGRSSLEALGQSHWVEFFDLEGAISPSILSQEPTGERSDLLTALEKARSSGGGRPLAGMVLFSDGADNGDLQNVSTGGLSDGAKQRLRQLGAPINVVNPADRNFQDLNISNVIADEFAFIHNTAEITVALEVAGLGSVTVPVTLKRDEQVVATQQVALTEGKIAEIVFKTKPDQIGEFVYTVSVPVIAGDALPSNNERSFVLRVVRDKIRVLQVSGRPSWDERFLRQHLKENPNVDLISFFILRTPSDVQEVPESELSLIPFPTDKLFTSELKSFDVIVFQNFDFRSYNMESYLRNIRDAVEGGLGFVIIGGEQGFGNGGYSTTPVADILPVTLEENDFVQGKGNLQLTAAGKTHPVAQVGANPQETQELWPQLSNGVWYNRVMGLKPGATALVTHSNLKAVDGTPLPVVAVSEAGQGRSIAIATPELWRWRFASLRDGGASERAYHRFWSNLLRWAVRDPEHSRVRVVPTQRRVDVGRDATVLVTVLDRDYKPRAGTKVRLSLEESRDGVLSVEDAVTDEAGVVNKRYPQLRPGAYQVSAETNDGSAVSHKGQGVFMVESQSLELSRPTPRPEVLRLIAEETGGKVLEPNAEIWDDMKVVDPEAVEIDRRRNVEIWDNAWAMMVGLGLLVLDWALRRRHGYL